jgi:hypothetical protein
MTGEVVVVLVEYVLESSLVDFSPCLGLALCLNVEALALGALAPVKREVVEGERSSLREQLANKYV